MREFEFMDRLDSVSLDIPPYWSLNCKGDVMVDYEEMIREFERKLQEIKEIENGK